MPASTSETASRSVSTSDSSCSERLMAFIGYFLVFACEASAEVPRTTTLSEAIRAADFDRIAANMGRFTDIPARLLGKPLLVFAAITGHGGLARVRSRSPRRATPARRTAVRHQVRR